MTDTKNVTVIVIFNVRYETKTVLFFILNTFSLLNWEDPLIFNDTFKCESKICIQL